MKLISVSLTTAIGAISLLSASARLHKPSGLVIEKNAESPIETDDSRTYVGEVNEDGAPKAVVRGGARELSDHCWSGNPAAAWHPTYSAGWIRGHCRFTVDCNSPSYSTQLDCCRNAYRGQMSGYCLSTLPNPPTQAPTGSGGLDVYYPLYEEAWSDGYCVNTSPMPSGRPAYTSQLHCCKQAYRGQISGEIR